MNFKEFLRQEEEKEYFKELMKFVIKEYSIKTCHPNYDLIFEAFKFTDFDNVKVVILGQDPYINYNEAHGLAFSTLSDKLPKSLVNIYKEISTDFNISVNQDGDLTYLAKQGVLLLNTILTVEHKKSLSHKNKGWETFTLNVIEKLNQISKPIVFILWGNNSIAYQKYLNNKKHLILISSHPSPLGAYHSFFGSKVFSKTNDFLIKNNVLPIIWTK